MNITAKDCKEAGDYLNAFFHDKSEPQLMINFDSEYEHSGYIIVKLPYTENKKNIVYLCGAKVYDTVLSPKTDLKYMGFYHLGTKQAYDIHEPFECFFRFEHKYISEDTLKTMVIEALQKTIADIIAGNADKIFNGISAAVPDSTITTDVEIAFSKKETTLDFAKKIAINPWNIAYYHLVDYVDNPKDFLKMKAEEEIKSREEELFRLWTAHCTAQKILDQLNSVYSGGNENKK